MSTYLKILPEDLPNTLISFNVIDFGIEDENYDELTELVESDGIEVPKEGITGYCATNDDGNVFFGKIFFDGTDCHIVRSVTVKQFLNALKGYKPDNYTNRAVIAYLKELPKELKLFLYWH